MREAFSSKAIIIRYNKTLNMLQIKMIVLYVLLKSWGVVQHNGRLYNLVQYNLSPVKPAHVKLV